MKRFFTHFLFTRNALCALYIGWLSDQAGYTAATWQFWLLSIPIIMIIADAFGDQQILKRVLAKMQADIDKFMVEVEIANQNHEASHADAEAFMSISTFASKE